jgi:DNA recombination protein RmuC
MTAFEVLTLIGLVILIGMGGAILMILMRDSKADLEPKLEAIDTRLGDSIAIVNLAVTGLRAEVGNSATSLREELSKRVEALGNNLQTTLGTIGTHQSERFDGFAKQLTDSRNAAGEDAKLLRTEVTNSLGELGKTVEGRLDKIRTENAEKLEQMRVTVDEKLQGTLEQRLGASFNQVNESLKRVFESVGEMQNLATGVGDLKRVLSNVKLRGTWGEGTLRAILQDILTPEQYAENIELKPHSCQRVEFALRVPGSGDNPVWVAIDSKLPQEDFERLKLASEQGDPVAVEQCAKALERCVIKYAKDVADKYIYPPHTVPSAILFFPSEGLFAEVVRRPGLVDKLRSTYRVDVTGPTTLMAYLHALRLGFQSLAIQQRSTEVWQVLGAVKTEFDKFGIVLEKVHRKLGEAQNAVEDAHRRRRVMNQKLRDVQALPEAASQDVLALTSVMSDELFNDDEPAAEAAE